MNKQAQAIQSWSWLIGGLFLASAWLFAALEPTMARAWNLQAVVCLCLSSLSWGISGWHRAHRKHATYESKAFICTIFAIIPWIGFLFLIIAPYALGVRRGLW